MSTVSELRPKMNKRTITVSSGQLHNVVDESEQVLADKGRYFSSGGGIVSVQVDVVTGAASTMPVSQHMLAYELSSAALYQRLKSEGDSISIDPPSRHLGVLNDRREFKYLKQLDGVASQPYLRPDGSLCSKSGYDSATRIFCQYDQRKYAIPDSPSKQDALAALSRISALLDEFEFKEQCDLSAALAAMLTASTRVTFPTAPFFFIQAHLPGSGKTYMQCLVSLFASAGDSLRMPYPINNDECQKMLLSAYLRSPPVIEFDNLTTDLFAHSSICTALTSSRITGRVLGESKTADVSTRSFHMGSGNNVGPVDDMLRRTLVSRLQPTRDDPQNRTFKTNTRQLLADNRESYVLDALTIIRAYITAGRPAAHVPAIAGFDDWAESCRQPLIWLGLPDPCKAMIQSASDNPAKVLEKAIIDSLYEQFKARPFTVRKVVDTCNDELRDLLAEVASDDGLTINNKRLGWWFRNKTGHSGNGNRLVSAETKKTASWYVELTEADADEYQKQSQGY